MGRIVTMFPTIVGHDDEVGGQPATYIDTICTSGNARPMPSASSSGSPSWAAQATGATPFAAADLRRHDRGRRAAEDPLDLLRDPLGLVLAVDHLVADGRRADPGQRHDQRVCGQVRQLDERHRPVLWIARIAASDPVRDVPSASGAQDGTSSGEGGNVTDIDGHMATQPST